MLMQRQQTGSTPADASQKQQIFIVNAKSSNGKKLKPLKLLVMSATLDTKGFCEYFNGAKVVYVQGRQFPVEIFYTYTAEGDYLDAALLTTFQVLILADLGIFRLAPWERNLYGTKGL